MKRILLFVSALIMAIACGQKKAEGPKTLVLYYSQTGNTQKVAELIQEKVGADIEAIVPVVPYDGDYNATIERGRVELFEGKFPEIQPLKVNVADYDVIFIGFPVWFGTYAPPVETMLNNVDLKGKKIVPFCTFGSGGLDSSSKNLAAKLTEAEILPGYGVRAARMDAIDAELDQFLKSGGFIEGEPVPVEAFPLELPVTEEQSAIFDAAVAGYPMLNAKAEFAACRRHPLGGQEYLFTAVDQPRDPQFQGEPRKIKVYVLVEEGKAPVFTQVCR